ncbi:MAG: chromosomal replication initiator protein DnaA [Chloroflexi bacterium]|nr:chromosomal replication initiator protein DnaA [Chloroflexota bacterium]
MPGKTASAQQVWETALGSLQVQITKANYNTFLKDTRGISLNGNQFTVGVPSTFAKEWLEKRLRSLIKRTLSQNLGQETDINFMEAPSAASSEASLSKEDQQTTAREASKPAGLNPRYTFSTFVVGNCNRLAHAAALGVTEAPGKSYNPLFIYGGAGLGKTHLLHAIGHLAAESSYSLLYVTSEQFTNEFITAIKERKTTEFRARYRSADMLLLDDIQFLAGKEQTQEGLFHIFNELHNESKQIAITSDRPPKSLNLMEDRLRSRFEWGLIADVQPPDLETRQAILRAKAEAKNTEIPNEVLEFIARKVRRNIRELEGALNQVVARAQYTGKQLNLELATEALAEMPGEAPWKRIAPAQVIGTVAEYYKLVAESLSSPKREKPLTQARQVAMYIMREDMGLTLDEIGRLLGGRDHKTIHHGYGRIASSINDDLQLRHDILEIRDRVLLQATGQT